MLHAVLQISSLSSFAPLQPLGYGVQNVCRQLVRQRRLGVGLDFLRSKGGIR